MSIKMCFVYFVMLLGVSVFSQPNTLFAKEVRPLELYKRALSIAEVLPDSAYQLVTESYSQSVINSDSGLVIECLFVMTDIQKNKGNYGKAYDHIWDALLLAEEWGDLILVAEAHQVLGMMYGIFNNEEQAISHMQQSLSIRKQLVARNEIKETDLSRPYFGLAVRYGRSKNYDLANAYLDSCMNIAEKYETNPNYVIAEQAYIAIEENELDKAERLLEEITDYFIDNEIRFNVMIYSFWGKLKMKQKQWSVALAYYDLCLQAMDANNTHTDIRPEVLVNRAKIYSNIGKSELSYQNLLKAKQIEDSLFNARNNSELFEIKNNYREAMELKNEEIAKQQKALEEKRETNFRLKMIIGFISLLVLATLLIFRNRNQRKHFKTEQNEIKLKAQLEKEKMDEVMEVKNKEITSYTLQLIDKERVIDDLLDELKKYVDERNYRNIRNSTKGSNKNLWSEFNERFTQVNAGFYKKLLDLFPSLSPTDLKHCALIKLNFNGKEMAQLLNISLPSVHIARHRLRKKFELKREDNLSRFINQL